MDFSARRAYFAEIFRGDALTNAISLDVVCLTGSSIVGPLFAGAIIELVDFSGSYALMFGLYLAAGWVLFTIPKTESMGEEKTPVMRQLKESVIVLATNRALVAALTITVSLNFFGFPFLTMVPVIGRDVLGANAFLYGVLAGAAGIGSLTGAIIIASRQIRNHGQVYSLGSAFMLGVMVLFALSEWYTVSLVLLIVAGLGMSGFATMQPTIALRAVSPEMRGRAMGAIALGIGASPLGMLTVGWMGAGEPRASDGVGGADRDGVRGGDGVEAYAAGTAGGEAVRFYPNSLCATTAIVDEMATAPTIRLTIHLTRRVSV